MRSKTPLTVTILGGVAALALVGCSTPQTGGTATTASSTTTTSNAAAIANPLDTTKLQKDLCSGLTPAQLQPYVGKVKNTSPDKNSTSSSCALFPTDVNQATVSIVVFPNLTVKDMQATKKNFPYSKDLAPIQGYPAQDVSLGNPPDGECTTSVAVADHVVVSVEVQASNPSFPNYNNMCVASEALAPVLISNLKG